MASKEELLKNLEVISQITPGKTLSVSTMSVVDHNSWSSAVTRRINGESRNKSIIHIKFLLLEAVSFYKLTQDLEIRDAISSAIDGFNNLTLTYETDTKSVDEIKQIVSENRKLLESEVNAKVNSEVNSEVNAEVNTEVNAEVSDDIFDDVLDDILDEVLDEVLDDVLDELQATEELQEKQAEIVEETDELQGEVLDEVLEELQETDELQGDKLEKTDKVETKEMHVLNDEISGYREDRYDGEDRQKVNTDEEDERKKKSGDGKKIGETRLPQKNQNGRRYKNIIEPVGERKFNAGGNKNFTRDSQQELTHQCPSENRGKFDSKFDGDGGNKGKSIVENVKPNRHEQKKSSNPIETQQVRNIFENTGEHCSPASLDGDAYFASIDQVERYLSAKSPNLESARHPNKNSYPNFLRAETEIYKNGTPITPTHTSYKYVPETGRGFKPDYSFFDITSITSFDSTSPDSY